MPTQKTLSPPGRGWFVSEANEPGEGKLNPSPGSTLLRRVEPPSPQRGEGESGAA